MATYPMKLVTERVIALVDLDCFYCVRARVGHRSCRRRALTIIRVNNDNSKSRSVDWVSMVRRHSLCNNGQA